MSPPPFSCSFPPISFMGAGGEGRLLLASSTCPLVPREGRSWERCDELLCVASLVVVVGETPLMTGSGGRREERVSVYKWIQALPVDYK